MDSTVNEKMIERFIPMIEERVTYNVIQRVIEALQEMIYPSEDMIRDELINEVHDAEMRIRNGEGIRLRDIHELERSPDRLTEDE